MDGADPVAGPGPAPGQAATAQVWVPLRRDGRLFGALGVVAAETAEQVGDTRILTAALEFGALAGALLGPAQVETLRGLAVDMGQGFLLGRPVPVASVAPGVPAGRGGGPGGRRRAAR